MKKKRIVLFHPWLKTKGGAERVVLTFLEKTVHDVCVYTWAYDAERTFEQFKNYDIRLLAPRFAQGLSRTTLSRALLFPLSFFKKIDFNNKDIFLISTGGVGEFILFRNRVKGKSVAYVHTPLREANKKIMRWNLRYKYTSNMKKLLYLTGVLVYRFLEKLAWKRLDYAIFNSSLSKSRAEEHDLLTRAQTTIIAPPLTLTKTRARKEKDYLLYFSRFNPPKRQDVLVEAWKSIAADFPKTTLILAGNPDDKAYFSQVETLCRTTPRVEIKTHVSDSSLQTLLAESRAGIFLGYAEDFGIVPLEIISSGKPLLGVDEGGYIDAINNHPLFYPFKEKHDKEAMIEEVARALRKFLEGKKKPRKKVYLHTKDFNLEIDTFLSSL